MLFAHSADLIGAKWTLQSMIEGYGFFIGNIAVNVFFVVSGFLVTASLFNRGNIAAFFWARFLRIFPGLWVATLLTVFGLGVWATRLPVGEYLDFAHNAFLFMAQFHHRQWDWALLAGRF